MSAAQTARGAADDVGEMIKIANQMRIMLGQVNAVRAQANEIGNRAKLKLAAAAEQAAGGIGTGQSLQVQVGQIQVKLAEVEKALTNLAGMCNGVAAHSKGVQNNITSWSSTLRS